MSRPDDEDKAKRKKRKAPENSSEEGPERKKRKAREALVAERNKKARPVFEAAAARLSEQRKKEIDAAMAPVALTPNRYFSCLETLDPRTDDDQRYITLIIADQWTKKQRKAWVRVLKEKAGEDGPSSSQ